VRVTDPSDSSFHKKNKNPGRINQHFRIAGSCVARFSQLRAKSSTNVKIDSLSGIGRLQKNYCDMVRFSAEYAVPAAKPA
jgi:hypothetical protein